MEQIAVTPAADETHLTIVQDAPEQEPQAPAAPMFVTELRSLPLSEIYVAGNYRSTIDPAGLDELAVSVKHNGLVQPVAVRALTEPIEGKHFALIAGFRRFAAHEKAELPTIDCNVRHGMSDAQVEEWRVIENLQREAPHPADEAAAVARLAALDIDQEGIASRLGKTPRWVAQRRALSELLPEWLKLLRSNKLTLQAAEELCRWPHSVQQRLFETGGGWQSITHGNVTNWLSQEARKLSAAPWSLSDETLVEAAGACSACPKRSSCATVLFAEMAAHDTCLDKVCWATKTEAQITRKVAELSTDEKPAQLLNVIGYGGQGLPSHHYEKTRAKKGSVWGVYANGPQAGHAVLIKLTDSYRAAQERTKALPSATPALTKGQQAKQTRLSNLMRESRKQVTAERIMNLLNGPVDAPETAQAVTGLLGFIVTEQLKKGRNNLNDVLVAGLVKTFGWEKPEKPLDYYTKDKWVQTQLEATANTPEKLIRLLMYLVVHHEMATDYEEYQTTVAKGMNMPEAFADIPEVAKAHMERLYDPATLRRRK
ncbi:ParB/RepB/Spo0J family partition protein [Hymenobacter jeollabukensis]|uniref:ParB/RepB/Spo0J family partition protein n=1 Tax=Hymenobacter jeollabukensis TaxID=2025313 RepID=A0A5R8WII2_9BACT|nr:ParB/RepB/Spo0J family partition protein [Hymenobacter jeollabukensis]TLM88689.1 ParB/RepB/Spo0J family partition protein [Hymenobacter jeollabukensis]